VINVLKAFAIAANKSKEKSLGHPTPLLQEDKRSTQQVASSSVGVLKDLGFFILGVILLFG